MGLGADQNFVVMFRQAQLQTGSRPHRLHFLAWYSRCVCIAQVPINNSSNAHTAASLGASLWMLIQNPSRVSIFYSFAAIAFITLLVNQEPGFALPASVASESSKFLVSTTSSSASRQLAHSPACPRISTGNSAINSPLSITASPGARTSSSSSLNRSHSPTHFVRCSAFYSSPLRPNSCLPPHFRHFPEFASLEHLRDPPARPE